jgi:hypothetical protein
LNGDAICSIVRGSNKVQEDIAASFNICSIRLVVIEHYIGE